MGPVLRSAESSLKLGEVGMVTVEVEATATRREFLTFGGHPVGIPGLDFFREGRHFVTARNDGTLKMWDAGPIG
jgi:hypothetical protein